LIIPFKEFENVTVIGVILNLIRVEFVIWMNLYGLAILLTGVNLQLEENWIVRGVILTWQEYVH